MTKLMTVLALMIVGGVGAGSNAIWTKTKPTPISGRFICRIDTTWCDSSFVLPHDTVVCHTLSYLHGTTYVHRDSCDTIRIQPHWQTDTVPCDKKWYKRK